MFNPMDTISIGPLTVSIQMLFVIVGIGVGFLGLHLYLKLNQVNEEEKVKDAYTVSIIFSLLIYKLWPFIIQPSLLLEPSNLLYYMGGPYAVIAAFTGGAGYFLVHVWRKKWSYHAMDGFSLAIALSFIVYYLFVQEIGRSTPFSIGYNIDGSTYHPVNFYRVLLFSLLIISSFVFAASKKYGKTIFLFVGFLLSVYLVSSFTI